MEQSFSSATLASEVGSSQARM
uniref:Uncharacterized protein n=1 Tax=Arundo donax TaxID=35708 RepID=A0A0A9CED6_ARUDO